jgi:hypothetical protein
MHPVHGMALRSQSQTLSQPSQDQTNQQNIDDITQSTSVEAVLHSIPKSFDSGDDGIDR